MGSKNPFDPVIVWRRGLGSAHQPNRDPEELDVRDGRAEYVLGGPYNLAEGASIEVKDGKICWSGGTPRPN